MSPILDLGLNLTLRPLQYPDFYEMYKLSIANTWTVDEVDWSDDIKDLHSDRITEAERHLIQRLVAFFATGDSLVANNVALSLYKHVNSPEGRLYLSRQLAEEAQHIEFYLTLLDNYIPNIDERHEMFRAIETVPSIKKKADFCLQWVDMIHDADELDDDDKRRRFLLNLIAYAACTEGLFFGAAFAYVFFLRNKGLLNGLGTGTNWVFRDESMHMGFGFAVIKTVKEEYPDLFDAEMERDVRLMMMQAVSCEYQFAQDLLGQGVVGMSLQEMRQFLEFTADRRLSDVGCEPLYNAKNPFPWMTLQDVSSLTNFFERRVSDYRLGGDWSAASVQLDEDF